MEKGQREYFLRQQLKAIQEELGEGDEEQAEVDELRAPGSRSSSCPRRCARPRDRELSRLERLPPAAAEYGVDPHLPRLDPRRCRGRRRPRTTSTSSRARRILDEDHFDLEKVKERIIEYLAVSKLKNDLAGPDPLLRRAARASARPRSASRSRARSGASSCASRSAACATRRRSAATGARTSARCPARSSARSATPSRATRCFLIDEIDKMGADFRGDPASAMLEVLDPEQNSTFRDHYLDLPFDLSKVLFICTANPLDTIPAPLLDRMDVIQLSGYTEDEKLGIAQRYLVPKQLEAHGLERSQRRRSPTATLRLVIREYTREAGVRNLERQLAALCRKAATQVAQGQGEADPRRRAARARVARAAALLGRGAQADGRAGRRHRARRTPRSAATSSSSRRPPTRARAG